MKRRNGSSHLEIQMENSLILVSFAVRKFEIENFVSWSSAIEWVTANDSLVTAVCSRIVAKNFFVQKLDKISLNLFDKSFSAKLRFSSFLSCSNETRESFLEFLWLSDRNQFDAVRFHLKTFERIKTCFNLKLADTLPEANCSTRLKTSELLSQKPVKLKKLLLIWCTTSTVRIPNLEANWIRYSDCCSIMHDSVSWRYAARCEWSE